MRHRKSTEVSFPSEMEMYEGIVFDPLEGIEKISAARELIVKFISEFRNGEVPQASISEIRDAAYVLGEYAGLPAECFDVDCFLFDYGGQSFQTTVAILEDYLVDMLNRIEKRSSRESRSTANSFRADPQVPISDDEIPF